MVRRDRHRVRDGRRAHGLRAAGKTFHAGKSPPTLLDMSTTPGNQPPSNSDPAANDITLLCVDMQPVFIRAMTDGARVQRRCEFAIAAPVGLGIRAIFSEQVPEKLGGTAPEVARLAPGAPVLGKNTFSAFGAP